MPAREKTSATFLAAAVEPPGTVGRAGEAEIGRLADGCSARPRYRLLRGELIGRSSRSVAPIILCRQRNYKANSCQGTVAKKRPKHCSVGAVGGAGAFACQLLIRDRGWQAEAPAPRPQALIDRLRHQLDVLLARRLALGALLDPGLPASSVRHVAAREGKLGDIGVLDRDLLSGGLGQDAHRRSCQAGFLR